MMDTKSKAEWKKVEKDEFVEFVNNYPRKLSHDVTGVCEPPLESYNDFELYEKWPESMVAQVSRDWLGPNGEVDREGHKRFYEYYIRTDIKGT